MEIISIIFYISLFCVLANEISLFLSIGGFAGKEYLSEIDNMIEGGVSLNKYNNNILNIGKSKNTYISHFGFLPGILSFYHISDIDDDKKNKRIPNWSKTHKKISYCFKIAKFKLEKEINERRNDI